MTLEKALLWELLRKFPECLAGDGGLSVRRMDMYLVPEVLGVQDVPKLQPDSAACYGRYLHILVWAGEPF